MNFIKNTPKKLIYLVIVFFVIHFVLQLLTLFYLAAAMHIGIETGQSPWWDDISWISFNVISFPFISLLGYLFSPFTLPIPFNLVLFLLNSILWSLVFYLIVNKVLKLAKK